MVDLVLMVFELEVFVFEVVRRGYGVLVGGVFGGVVGWVLFVYFCVLLFFIGFVELNEFWGFG